MSDYQEILNNWSVTKEQQKADFMEHMYYCSGRQDPSHPMHSLYTGLWQDFCIKEAGPKCRDEFFERLQFIKDLEEGKIKAEPVFLS